MAGARAVMAASALALPLWAAGCVSPPPQQTPPPSSAPLVDAGPTPGPATAPSVPAPEQQSPPPEGTAGETQGSAPTLPARTAPGGTPEASPAPEVPPLEDPASPEPLPSGSAAAPQKVTAYYVLLDDGGSNGVRFGCNDSLVGIAHTTSAEEDPLPAAVRALLNSPADAGGPRGSTDVYNALLGSDLKFLSGSFDGTTVTVYLAGRLSMGGVCDLPRVEAQLTQTAVSAVGAIRAEIYINGRSLAEALRQD
ncbi:GerMN domain-containing protein [Arthrobacter sp. D3-16]